MKKKIIIIGKKNRPGVTVDIRPFLKRRNIRFIEGKVTAIRDAGRSVVVDGAAYHNDALFLGIGSAFLEDDIPGTREHTFSPCRGPDDMEAFMRELDAMDRGTLYLGFKINKRDGLVAGGMRDPDGTLRKADLVLYSPGITAPDLVRESCLPVTAGGQIEVDKFGQASGLERVFAAGDCAAHHNPPPWVPHQAHMARLRSQAAAKSLRAVLKDE